MGRAAVDNHIKAPPKPADRVLLMAVVILLLGGCWVVFDSSYPFAVESVKGRIFTSFWKGT